MKSEKLKKIKKNIEDFEIIEDEPRIHIDTKKSIAAILMIGLAVILLLSKFDKAGPIGRIVYLSLNNFFGWGYYLLPIMSVVVALVFLIGQKQKFLIMTFIGAGLSVVFGF